jgi:TonB-linked SusC/RagA family outer membrane protein
MHHTSRFRFILSMAAVAAMLSAADLPLAAQATGTVRGTVVEAGTLRPVSGVQVSVPALGRGALTDTRGRYLIVNVPAGEHTVRAQMLGYGAATERVNVQPGQSVTANLTLETAAVELDQIVVTGTAGPMAKRAIGNAVTTIDAAEILSKATNTTVQQMLQARTPGLTYMGSGGTVGAGGSIRIRGAGSLTAGNNPVIYIDGVRLYSGTAGNWSNTFSAGGISTLGGQHALALDQINPEDIESIEVIKGPAAATLYGAEAAGGVIQIITKKGQAGQQDVRWNARADYGSVDWSADPVTNFTACTAERMSERLDDDDPASPMAWIGCQGQQVGDVISFAGLAQNPTALRTGLSRNYQLSVTGGGDGFSYYLAGDNDYEEGVFLNNFMERTSARANFSFYPTDILDFTVNVGYTNTHTRHPLNDNTGQGLIISAAMWRPGFNYPEAVSSWDPAREGFAWASPSAANEYDNQLWGDRLILGSTINYRPFGWWRNRLTVGFDYNPRTAVKYAQPGSMFSSEGYVFERRPINEIYTVDYNSSFEHQLTDAIESNLSAGVQYLLKQYKDTRAYGYGFGSPLHRLVNQAAETNASDYESQSASLGMYVQEQVGWRDRLFLTGAVRMDNNSVFGEEIKQIFYPKAMASWVVSEEPFFGAGFVDQLRLRAAYGVAGSAPGPFDAVRSYAASTATLPDGTSAPALLLSSFGNPDLKPERGTELELGFDLGVLDNRAGLEFTYYHQTMEDAIMSVPTPPSSGFTRNHLENLGKTRNSGFEAVVSATPVRLPDVSWDARLSLYTNDNELVSFGYERDPILLGFYGRPQRHVEGYPLAGFWSRKLVMEGGQYARDAEGDLVLTDEAEFIGSVTPTREIGFSNTITLFNRVDLYALLDYKGGHYQYDYKDLSRCSGSRCEVVARAEAALADPNATEAQQEAAQLDLDLYTSAGGLAYYDRKVNFIQPADFVKLRDLSLTYRMPEQWSSRLGAERASFTLAGHDLWVYAPDYMGPDPEVNFYGSEEFWRVDSWTAPMLRRISASVNVSF